MTIWVTPSSRYCLCTKVACHFNCEFSPSTLLISWCASLQLPIFRRPLFENTQCRLGHAEVDADETLFTCHKYTYYNEHVTQLKGSTQSWTLCDIFSSICKGWQSSNMLVIFCGWCNSLNQHQGEENQMWHGELLSTSYNAFVLG
jgi:hypothetical protein